MAVFDFLDACEDPAIGGLRDSLIGGQGGDGMHSKQAAMKLAGSIQNQRDLLAIAGLERRLGSYRLLAGGLAGMALAMAAYIYYHTRICLGPGGPLS